MFRKRGFAAVIAALLITVFTVVGCGGQKKQRVSIATGGSGGVFFVLGAGIADLITKNSPKMQATSETTAATGENLRLVNTGEAQFAFTVFDATSDAYNGVTPYKKHDNIRLILRGHAGFLHAYVQENSEINSLADFRGKRIGIPPGEVGRFLLANSIAPYGLKLQDLKVIPQSISDSNTALQDGTVDAVFQLAGLPGSSMMDISNQIQVRYINFNDQELKETLKLVPAWGKGVIPAKMYKGQAEAVSTIKVPYSIIAGSQVSDELVYEFTKILIENTETLKAMHPEGINYGASNEFFQAPTPVPYHSGAEKYLKEKGIVK